MNENGPEQGTGNSNHETGAPQTGATQNHETDAPQTGATQNHETGVPHPSSAWVGTGSRKYLGPTIILLAALLAIALVAQLYASRAAPRQGGGHLGASLENFVLILCDRIFLSGVFAEPGHRHVYVAGRPFGVLIATVMCVLAIPIIVLVARRAPSELKLFGLVATGIVVAGLLSPLISVNGNDWHIMATSDSAARYFFMARVAWVASLVWAATRLPRVWMTRTAWVAAAIAFASGFPVWGYTPFVNDHWPQEARTIETSAPGTKLLLPVPPGNGWAVDITVK